MSVMIIDLNQIIIADFCVMANTSRHKIQAELDLLRHICLNQIRGFRNKYGEDYEECILAADDHDYWRKQIFPYYKASRKKHKETSTVDWNELYACLNQIKEEIVEYLPYKLVQVPHAEADDVIGVITKDRALKGESVLIISGDKDFIQLQRHGDVKQFDPIRRRMLKHPNPAIFLKEHIIKGDVGDGVPNFLSADDTFVVEGKRQKPVSKKKMEVWLTQQPEEFCNEDQLRNYHRNKILVDLDSVPKEIVSKIWETWENAPVELNRMNLFKYFVKNNLRQLANSYGDFT